MVRNYSFIFLILLSSIELTSQSGISIDQDGNEFNWHTYGDLIWATNNSSVVNYRDGTPIPNIEDTQDWENLTTGAWCSDDSGEILYNWYAVAGIHDNDESTPNKELAPEEWHVSTDIDFEDLKQFLISNGFNYDSSFSGNKIAKALASPSGWMSSTTTGDPGNNQTLNNTSGFDALPIGNRNHIGVLLSNQEFAVFWSSTDASIDTAINYNVNYQDSELRTFNDYKGYGSSVRFVKNSNTASLGSNNFNSLKIYPNPPINRLYTSIDGSYSLKIFDQLGQQLLQADNTNNIDVSALKTGIYFVTISDGISSSTKTFIKK